ncbi:MAG: 5,6-dimethylbenzimidazole synthase [Nitrospinae bacterium]|nr:5,6-dimethylbenzimidazole synthase [Nitrospinota bacterium]
MMKNNILITGGCRSGKNLHALALAHPFEGRKVYVATAQTLDDEMRERAENHQRERGDDWITFEEPLDVKSVFKREGDNADIFILDCLTLWVTNLLLSGTDRENIRKQADELIEEVKKAKGTVIVITNEVGAGIVPDNKLSRDFRDIAGDINQSFAAEFDTVVHMVSGIPVTIKEASGDQTSQESLKTSPHEFSSSDKAGVYKAIYKRRDVRHFTSRPVAPDALGRILDAAHHAGSVGFMQPWDFLVIDDPEIKQKVALNFKKASADGAEKFSGERKSLYESLKLEGITDAAINICVTCDTTRFGPNVLGRNTIKETDVFSTCCAVQNLWLAARAEGLAVGWVSILYPDQLKRDLEIPENILPVAYLCLGHTESFYEKPMLESAGWAKRISLGKLVHYNKWQGAAKNYSVILPEAV